MPDSTLTISTDRSKMDVVMIHRFLSTTYWANGRSREQVQSSIDNSNPFGMFLDGRQIAFARVLSDKAVFAYVMDVFVVEEHRGQGYATQLMKYILQFPEFATVETWMLKTKDAHTVYEGVGFAPITDADRWMALSK